MGQESVCVYILDCSTEQVDAVTVRAEEEIWLPRCARRCHYRPEMGNGGAEQSALRGDLVMGKRGHVEVNLESLPSLEI